VRSTPAHASSRARSRTLSEFVQALRSQAVPPIAVGDGGWRGNLAKFFSPSRSEGQRRAAGLRRGPVAVRRRRPAVAAAALGALRLGARRALRPDRPLRHECSGSSSSRCSNTTPTGAAGARCTPVHARRRRRARRARLLRPGALLSHAYDSSSTAPSSAAARSVLTRLSCRSRCSRRSAYRRSRRRLASASCSTRCATARRRTAASPSGSTA